ncbi:MAG: transcription-repair coupling factor [Nitrospirota bacterium]
MNLTTLLPLLTKSLEFITLTKNIINGVQKQSVCGLYGSSKAYFLAGLKNQTARPLFIISPGQTQAERLYLELTAFLEGTKHALPAKVFFFPSLEVLPYDEVPAHKDLVGERLAILDNLIQYKKDSRVQGVKESSEGKIIKHLNPGTLESLNPLSYEENIILVSSLPAILFKIASCSTLNASKLVLEVSTTDRGATSIKRDVILEKLMQIGYSPDETVETKGTFSHRGGIVDVFPVNANLPVRLEFFGDDIESIRQFDPITQRSVSFVEQATIMPDSPLENGDRGLLQNTATIFDYLPKSSLVVLDDPAYLENEANRLKDEVFSLYEQAQLNAQIQSDSPYTHPLPPPERGLPHPDQFLISWEEMQREINTRQLLTFEDEGEFKFFAKPPLEFKNNFKLFINEFKGWQEEGNQVVIAAGYKGQEERIKELLKDSDVEIPIVTANLNQEACLVGFQFPELQLVLITDKEIFGSPSHLATRRFATQRVAHADTLPISTFTDLKPGDYVVHVNYGIGKYAGITTLTVEGIKKDLLLIEYADGDKLYVPLDQFGLVEKYIGDKDRDPRIYRLNDAVWSRVKRNVKKSVESIAKELIELYASRKALPGHAFSKDGDWQYEFETGFVYEETPDQIKVIEEIKVDMEKSEPMDRLVCGDVGYGKTEVALRAAFKAMMDNKQVAVLVPTTILAFQHYNTFTQRLAPFPIKVEMLSRFRTKAEQRKILEGLKAGEIDIVIGTHRLLQKDVEFQKLSLVVIDEEQRFGVKAKEKLKQLRKLVDVLTLTATPIPRTLYMSLSGARDMSIINTPPPERLPIKTFVLPFSEQVIREAILREMDRQGQIYFVHTQVKTIQAIATSLKKIVPEAKIAIAHGQMGEHELEKVMLEFLEQKYDVLLSTSIIESGIDIASVNTVIINNAHQFGLSQLYQLRGRVGRAKHMAYAYLLYPARSLLSDLAKERLSAIREFSDLGSGFKLAMRDLEIRGAGNIIGHEQHGNLLAVGFDLYCKLLQEAVATLKGEEIVDDSLPVVDLPYDTYIPEEYIGETTQRYAIYKKLSCALDFKVLQEIEEEIADRYGKIPLPVKRLLELFNMRLMAKKVGITSLSFSDGQLVLELPVEERLIPKVISLIGLFPEYLKLNPKRTNYLIMEWISDDESICFLKEVLQELQ